MHEIKRVGDMAQLRLELGQKSIVYVFTDGSAGKCSDQVDVRRVGWAWTINTWNTRVVPYVRFGLFPGAKQFVPLAVAK